MSTMAELAHYLEARMAAQEAERRRLSRAADEHKRKRIKATIDRLQHEIDSIKKDMERLQG